MVEDLPADFVPRSQEFDELIDKLLDEQREEPIAITAALRGAGGYGKTTMAKALCHDERIQQAFDDGILWVTLGEHPGNLVGKVEDLIYTLSRERPGFTGIDAATAHLAELLAERDMLLVIDDVWNAAHLKPFLQGGKRCARLITTRNEEVLPVHYPEYPGRRDAVRMKRCNCSRRDSMDWHPLLPLIAWLLRNWRLAWVNGLCCSNWRMVACASAMSRGQALVGCASVPQQGAWISAG